LDNLPFSSGWVYLIGGLAGIVTVLRSKKFSWKNYEFLASEEDRNEEVPMTPIKRLILISICVLIGAYGAIEVQRDHGWNAFSARATQHQANER
jgi:hypothetical protein